MQQPQQESRLLDLREFLDILRRRKWAVGLTTVLVAVLALGLVYRRTPLYVSQAQVEVEPADTAQQSQDINMETEATRVTQEQIASLAAPAMGLDADSSLQLAKAAENVQVSVPTDTTYLDISCSASSPSRARTCAAAFANAYVQDRTNGAQDRYSVQIAAITKKIRLANRQLDELERQSPDSAAERKDLQRRIDGQNQIILAAQSLAFALPSPNPTAAVVSRSATLPSMPGNKPYALTGLLATLLGLVLGVGLAFVRERLDERIRDGAGFEKALGGPVLATVPHVKGLQRKQDARLITRDAPGSPAAEAYRTARPALLHLVQTRSVKVVAVAGPGAGEGKTTTSANLAVALARGGERVVVVCCDLRKPRLSLFFEGVKGEMGLSDILNTRISWRDALRETDFDGLFIIPGGTVPENPSELLGTSDMKRLLSELRGAFDLVLLDTAPALISADTITLVPATDGVVIVADASKTRRDALTQSRRLFEQVGGTIMGGILNNVHRRQGRRYLDYVRSSNSAGHQGRRAVRPSTGPPSASRK
jgi:capsular exopolysaccharide synthesis family protein